MSEHKSRRGRYYRTHPLDLELLRRLPVEGTQLGFHVIAATVHHLTAELNKLVPAEAALTGDQIQSRMRSMRSAGLVVSVPVMGSHSLGWQRTRKGELHYEEETGQVISDKRGDK